MKYWAEKLRSLKKNRQRRTQGKNGRKGEGESGGEEHLVPHVLPEEEDQV
ncbi:MAG: hypothetical protein MUO72_02970 [Bacteroidales bacterium]|nr:hypothetical protein [Bacteroidales bacterium]